MAVLAAGVLMLASLQPIEELAAQANVDPVDLAGAVNTTGLEPLHYLRLTGELPTPQPPPRATTVWDRLAQCECSGNWACNTGNGYRGGLQMDATFWRRHGGLAYAPAPHLASREAQIAVAIRGQAVQGWGAWPACSRRLGLR